MKKSLIQQLSKINRKDRRKCTWQQIVSVLCCFAILFTSYSFILPSIPLATGDGVSALDDSEEVQSSGNLAETQSSGTELIKKVEVVDEGDLSESVHWVVEDVTDAFGGVTRQVRIYGEGKMPDGLSPWKTYNTTIEKIIIEDGITNVSKDAFSNMTVVVSAELGNTITILDENAFYNCTAIEKINIPNSVREIGYHAIGSGIYNACKITELKLNEGLEKLGILGKLQITSIYIPKTVTYLAVTTKNNLEGYTFPFDNCSNLAEIIVDEENPNYTSDPTNKSILIKDGTRLIRVMRAATGEYTIPDGVTTIGTMAFSSCNISSVVFPDSVNYIEPGNFHSCNNITELNFPILKAWNASTYDTLLINSCRGLIKVTFKGFTDDFNYNAFATGCFRNCPSLTEVVFPPEVCKKITYLGANAFEKTAVSGNLLESFTNLKELRSSVFNGCRSMDKIVLGEYLEEIRASDFNDCLNVKEIVLNSKNLKLTLSKNETAFTNLVSCNKITIGNTVDTLDKSLMDTIFKNNIDEVVFEGPNVLEIPSGIVGPSPIGSLGGTYYADENGVLYKLESDGTTELAYFPSSSSLESYTVPATITVNGETYNVTKVAEAAFKNAKIKSVTFENPLNVVVSSYAFSNCKNLESVNGETAVNKVISLFQDAVSSAFFGTLLTGIDSNKGTASKETLVVSDSGGTAQFEISAKNATAENSFNLYTGNTATINVSISNSAVNQGNFGRIYIQYHGEDYNLPATVGETLNNSGFEYTFKKSDIEGIYYFEFKQPDTGKTGAFSFVLSYPSPNSAGGTAQVWSEILTSEENNALGNGVRFTEVTDKFYEYKWITVPRNITVTETVAANGSLVGSGSSQQKAYVNGMVFTVSSDTSNTGRSDIKDALANDLIKSFNFTSTLTLPSDFKLDEGIKTAIQSNNYYCLNTMDSNGAITSVSIYAVVGGENVLLATINASAEKVSLDCNENQLVIKYSRFNSSSTTEIATNYTHKITYGQGLFYTDKSIVGEELFNFENKVDVINNYTYSEPRTSSATATATVKAPDANITIKKADAFNGYLGDTQSYTIKISNNSVTTYEGFSYISDQLPQYVYISGENLQKMFLEEYGDKLSVTIDNAEIAKHSNEIFGNTVKSVSGTDCLITNQNTGYDVPYEGASPEGTNNENVKTGTIKIYWEADKLYAEYNGDKRAVNTANPHSLTNILDSLGYFVTKSARYTLKWDFGENYHLYGGAEISFSVYSQAMDTFMMLYYDHEGTYYNEYERIASNTATAYNTSGTQKLAVSNSTTNNRTHNREIYLQHKMFKNGEEINSNTMLVDGDVIQQTAMFKHFGNGTYGVLPLVNKISSNQQLLIRKDLNEGNADLASFEIEKIDGVEYYVLKCDGTGHTLTNVYTNVGEMAAKIDIDSSGILVHWYFDNLPAGEYIKSVDYLTRIDVSEETSAKWHVSVQSWLNDHQTHRLYLTTGAGGLLIDDFDKKIVTNPEKLGIADKPIDNQMTEKEFDELSNKQELDKFSFIGEGDKVTYLLKFKTSNRGVTIHGGDIYDCLPWIVSWQKSDITLKYFYDEDKVTLTNPENWNVTKENPSDIAVETDKEYSYIVWDDDFKAVIQANTTLYIYVTVSFPKDNLWDTFVNDNNGATLYNRFYLLGIVREVSHELKLPVRARIQKGVYELGSVYRLIGTDGLVSDQTLSNYTSDGERNYYLNTASKARFVVYYATICNNGKNKMYLNDMQDLLPKGIKFHSLVNSIGFKTATYRNREIITTNATISGNKTIFTEGKTLASIEGATLVNATVSANVLNISENSQKVTFSFSKTQAVTDEKILKYDDSYEKYYLNPNEAICFGYICQIDTAEKTENTATNRLALPIDSLGQEVYVNGNPSVVNGEQTEILDTNDGSCEVVANDIAEALGFNGYSDNTSWYLSDVSIKRGDIVPEISKRPYQKTSINGVTSAFDGFALYDDTVIWSIISQNTGEYSLNDYTISDTMRCVKDNANGNVLYRFEGPVSYIIYDEGESGDKGSIGRINLFNIVRSNTSDTIKITYNGTGNSSLRGYREKGSTDNFKTEITLEYRKEYEGYSAATLAGNTWYMAHFYFRLDKDAGGVETLTIHFSDDIFAIPGGGSSELRLSVTRNDKTITTAGQFRNDVQLIPNPEVPTNAELINYDRVASSEKVMKDGKVIGVASNSAFVVINGYATSSVKAVTELDSDGNLTSNTTSSDKTNNVITLKSAESKFEYTASVHLPKEIGTSSLVIIDTLPEIGDSSVFQADDLRGSQFDVDFTGDTPVVEVKYADGTTETLKLGIDYTIGYSSKTLFEDDDWNGTSAFDDVCKPSTHRAIRVNVTKELPADSIVNLYYRAVADDPSTVNDGKIAYSSFGYSYQVNVTSFARQQAAPLKVGVRAPNTVKLSKKLSKRDGSAYTAETEETFKFILYKGESLDLTRSNKAELAKKLGNREFTVVTLTVPEGNSESEKIDLSSDELKLYSYSSDSGEFIKGTSDWELTANEKYTVYEYEYNNNDYFFKAFGRDNSQNFTFTYNPAISQSIECENVFGTWQVSIVKKDYDNEDIRLEGAVFGLYSTDAADEISDEDLETSVNNFGLTNTPSKIETVTIGNTPTTVYLKHISSTDELGVVSWNDLSNSQYAVKELQAPKGYIVNEDDGEPNLRLINKPENISLESYTSVATYKNKIYYNLPEAGGTGRKPFYEIGVLLIAFSMIFYIYSNQHKYENEETGK